MKSTETELSWLSSSRAHATHMYANIEMAKSLEQNTRSWAFIGQEKYTRMRGPYLSDNMEAPHTHWGGQKSTYNS